MALSIKTDDASQEAYQNMYLEAKELDPTLTQGKFFADMVKKLKEPNPEPGPVDLSEYISLEQHNEIVENITRAHELVPVVEYVPEPMQENEIRFEIPEPHLSLLNETKKRLSEKYQTTITIKDILLDMFARYSIEQFNEWFYPFVIAPEEFESITGYNHSQLKQWLKRTK